MTSTSAALVVLVVDDDPDCRLVVDLALRFGGFDVIGVASGEEALAVVDHHQPDAIVLDVRLPGIDGWEVLRRLRHPSRGCRIPVVILSIAPDAAAVAATQGFDCAAYLSKPCPPRVLQHVVRAALTLVGGGDCLPSGKVSKFAARPSDQSGSGHAEPIPKRQGPGRDLWP